MPSVKQVCNALADNQDAMELRKLLEAIRVDLAALRAAHVALTAKLDADTVSGLDDDYAATCDPAALTTLA
jgi:hypothetical protein